MEELQNIIITVEAHGEKATFGFPQDVDMGELMQKFALIAHFLTFAPETIKEFLFPEE